MRKIKLENLKNKRLLVISPHADDEVLGCGGLISKVKKEGGKVFVLIFNVGSVSSSDNAIRHAPVKAGQNNNEICEKFELNRSCFK